MDYKLIEQQLDELNLDGYKHIKNNDWTFPSTLRKWLKEKDFKLKGGGVFSSVYQSTTENFVIKLNNGDIDKNYLNFVEFCQQNKGNPHLPKTGKIKKYEDWYILFIENLEKIPSYMDEFFDDDCLKAIVLEVENSSEKSLMNFISEKTYHYSINKKYNKQIMDISIILNEFIKKYNIGNRRLDLHAGNIMMRGNTLVITDPVI